MTSKQYEAFQKLVAEKFPEYPADYQTSRDIVDRAKYYIKLQKELGPEDTVRSLQLFVECTGDVEWFHITPRENYTYKQWCVILYASDLCIYSYEQIKTLLK